MIVTEFTPDPPYPQRIVGPDDENRIRSKGLHLSTVYRDMAETLNRREELAEEELAFYAAGGFLWERVFDMAHRDAVVRGGIVRPGELKCEGIAGTPDGLDFENERLVELKCRWMSCRKFDHLEKYFFFELIQVKSYLYMIREELGLPWNDCELTVFFVCGDWRPPIPTSRSVILSFTDQEIEEAWMVIKGHARRRGWLGSQQ